MQNLTRLAAVGFSDPNNHYRVYYQDSAGLIKESCYDELYGWFTRENSIVAKNAKNHSPIAAIEWDEGSEIRVYYLSDENENQILERKWNAKGNVWESGSELPSKPDRHTQLAAARVEIDEDKIQLRVFYQSVNLVLRQASYDSSTSEWKDIAPEYDGSNIKAFRGTSLTLSTRGGIRLFYFAISRDIEMLKEENNRWKIKKLGRLSVVEKTPMVMATLFETEDSETQPTTNAFFVDRNGSLLRKTFDTSRDTLVDYTQGEQSSRLERVEKNSALAIASPSNEETSVFYQPAPYTIAQYIMGTERAERALLGIPTSSGGAETRPQTTPAAPISTGESGMLGLVQQSRIDRMDQNIRQKFIQRLTETVAVIYGEGRLLVRNHVETLSKEFGLGIGWEGDGGIWGTRTYEQHAAVYSNTSYPDQTRLQAGRDTFAVHIANQFSQDYINKFLYYDTLYHLCRYLGVGKP